MPSVELSTAPPFAHAGARCVEASAAIVPYVWRECAERYAAFSLRCWLDLGDRRRRRRLIVACPARALATDKRMVRTPFRSQRMPGDSAAFQALSCRVVGTFPTDRSCGVLRGGSHGAVAGTPTLVTPATFRMPKRWGSGISSRPALGARSNGEPERRKGLTMQHFSVTEGIGWNCFFIGIGL